MKTRYTTANHSNGLKEMRETEKPIDNEAAETLIKTGLYSFYAEDERIKAKRYLLKDMKNRLGLPQWINKYEEEENQKITNKQKLIKIRELIANWSQIEISEEVEELRWNDSLLGEELTIAEKKMMQTLKKIWEFVKDEKR